MSISCLKQRFHVVCHVLLLCIVVMRMFKPSVLSRKGQFYHVSAQIRDSKCNSNPVCGNRTLN